MLRGSWGRRAKWGSGRGGILPVRGCRRRGSLEGLLEAWENSRFRGRERDEGRVLLSSSTWTEGV